LRLNGQVNDLCDVMGDYKGGATKGSGSISDLTVGFPIPEIEPAPFSRSFSHFAHSRSEEQTTIHRQRLAGDVVGRVAGQKQCNRSHIHWIRNAL
jgi:hypothetical protein